jgi:hypothetical protein
MADVPFGRALKAQLKLSMHRLRDGSTLTDDFVE